MKVDMHIQNQLTINRKIDVIRSHLTYSLILSFSSKKKKKKNIFPYKFLRKFCEQLHQSSILWKLIILMASIISIQGCGREGPKHKTKPMGLVRG